MINDPLYRNSISHSILENIEKAYTAIQDLKECVDEETATRLSKVAKKINAFGTYQHEGIYQELEDIIKLFKS